MYHINSMTIHKFSVFGLILGYTFGFIEGNKDFQYEKNDNSTPACYGSTYNSFVDAGCTSESDIMYPYKLFVGAKPKSLNCSTHDNEYPHVNGSELQRNCCRIINSVDDCTDEYSDHNITIFMKQCMAQNKCDKLPVVWKPTHNMSCPNTEYKDYSNYAYLEYYCIKKSSIGTVNRNVKFSRNKTPFYLTACDLNSYQNGIIERNVTCSIATSNRSTIHVWIMDLRFNTATTQKVTIGDQKLSSINATIFKPTLTHKSTSSVLNVTFETTAQSDEFLWLGFVSSNSDDKIDIVCDLREETYISSHTSSLTEDKKNNGMLIAGVGGGIAFLAICALLGVSIYRRVKRRSQITDDNKNLPSHEERSATESRAQTEKRINN